MLCIRDIMTTDVKALTPETTVRSAMEFLVENHLSGAPVVNGRSLVGVVSATDLLGFAATPIAGLPHAPSDLAEIEWEEPENREEFVDTSAASSAFYSELWDESAENVAERMMMPDTASLSELENHDVSEVMTAEVVTLPSSASAKEAAALMETRGIHRVLVVDNDELVGIVTALDITRAVAKGQFNVRTYIFNRDRDFAGGR